MILFLLFFIISIVIIASIGKVKNNITCDDLDILRDADEKN